MLLLMSVMSYDSLSAAALVPDNCIIIHNAVLAQIFNNEWALEF